jgi:hypothetical protein
VGPRKARKRLEMAVPMTNRRPSWDCDAFWVEI